MRRKCCVRRCNELGRCLAVEAPEAAGTGRRRRIGAGIIAFGMVDKTAGLGGAFCGVRSRCSPTRRLTGSTKAAFSDGDRSILPMALITVHRAHCSSASSIVARAIGCAAPRAPTQCQRNDERCVILHESGAPWLVGGRAEQRQPRIEVAASDKPFAIEAVGVGPRKCPAILPRVVAKHCRISLPPS